MCNQWIFYNLYVVQSLVCEISFFVHNKEKERINNWLLDGFKYFRMMLMMLTAGQDD